MSDKTGVLDSYHLGEVLKPSARKLGERCGAAAVEMLARRLTEYIGSAEDDKYSYIWRSAIEEHEQDDHNKDARAVLVDAVRDATLGATSTNSPTSLAIVKSLLQSPYPTLTRVGIYVCGEHYGTVGAVFWECATGRWFLEVPYWHELYWFINKAFSRFSSAQRGRFLELVEQLRGNWSDESRQVEWDEIHRRDLLHPAFGLGDSEVDEKYQKLVEQWGEVGDHPDFHIYSGDGWMEDRSPVTSDVLLGMTDDELVAFLSGFVPDVRSWDGPTYRGLASSISAAVRGSEDGFEGRMLLFADLARPYQHGLLRGLKERWSNDKREINWFATLALVKAIVSAPAFQADLAADQAESSEPTVHWVVGDIADLFMSATGTERHLPSELHKSCLQVLQIILVAAPIDSGEPSDAVLHAINTPRGRTLESFIHLALAMRREEFAANPSSNETWLAVRTVFDAELASSEVGRNTDFAAIAGMYCANLHYLNAEWTETNFDRLFSTNSEVAWRCAAQGFAYQHYMYDWLFKCLVTGGHLRRMVYTGGLPDKVAQRALQFLGLAYLEDKESLDGSGLLRELVLELKIKELSHLCWFFWTLRGKAEPSAHSSKILVFWMKVAEQLRVSHTELPALQSALSQLAVFIHDFTSDTVEALVEAAPHAQVGHHGYLLVENLARLASKYPKAVATIFHAAMSGFLPEFRKEDVIECVNRLAGAGEVEAAESICNAYAQRGSTMLKETYELLRASQR